LLLDPAAVLPDLNPIEMAFSKLKAHLRRIGARNFDQAVTAIGEICDFFTQKNAGTISSLLDMHQRKSKMFHF